MKFEVVMMFHDVSLSYFFCSSWNQLVSNEAWPWESWKGGNESTTLCRRPSSTIVSWLGKRTQFLVSSLFDCWISPLIGHFLFSPIFFIMVMGAWSHLDAFFFPSTHKHSSANYLINVLFFLFWATNVSLRQILRAFCYVSKKPWYLQIIRVQFEQYNWPRVFGWSVLSAFPEARRFSWLFEHNSKHTKPSTEGWHSISFDHFCRSCQGDGVSDGQFVNVLTRELNLLEHGFKQMSATYNPQLVIIVGQYFGSFWPVLLLQWGVSRFLFRSTSKSQRSYSLWCHFSAQGRGIRLVFGWSKVLKKVVAKSIPQIFRNKDGDFE